MKIFKQTLSWMELIYYFGLCVFLGCWVLCQVVREDFATRMTRDKVD